MVPLMQGCLLNAITIYHQLTSDQKWKELGRKVVDGMTAAVVREGDRAHFI